MTAYRITETTVWQVESPDLATAQQNRATGRIIQSSLQTVPIPERATPAAKAAVAEPATSPTTQVE